MQRNTTLASALVCMLALAGCSGTPQTLLSPSPVDPATAAVNPDGSTLKVSAPTDLSPKDVTVETLRPTLRFNSAVGRYVEARYAHEIEGVDANGNVIYSRVIGESDGVGTHVVESDLSYSDNYSWRVRARVGDQTGPWSEFAAFRTFDRPAPPPPPPGSALPFEVPASCGPFGPGDRTACALAVAAVAPWWPACRAGSGVNCHRYTRALAAALATHDPRWGLLSKNPNEQQCTWNFCGRGDGRGYGEDVVVHREGGTLRGWDVVGGAGAPGAVAGWSRLSGFRAGNRWVPVPLPLGTR